jgi:hypothetical protein
MLRFEEGEAGPVKQGLLMLITEEGLMAGLGD